MDGVRVKTLGGATWFLFNLMDKETWGDSNFWRRCYRSREMDGGGGGTWVKFCWVCAAGPSKPPYPIVVYYVGN